MLRYSYHESTSNAELRSTLCQLSGVASLPAKNSRQRRTRIPKLLNQLHLLTVKLTLM
jgi:hypothetical protein